ncbi:hypothetical protein GWI33_022224 [Rhynchophorus ferrugineus]|uniref:Mariner Mos1 transposase n=1 Tax=Rhynchophorus ferrugineus TaxID=354439 RepID=A0A834HN69_RHYFE|nr:hypothetical protein GWI33_022224 [Rhynchophorus ferrugineus]
MNPLQSVGKRKSTSKVMACLFWDAHRIIFIDYLEKGRTINSDYYIAFLGRLKDKTAKKRAAFEEKESVASPRQCTVSQVSENDSKNPSIHRILQIWLLATISCSRSQKNARWEEVFGE